jgi:hypothetical protein
LSWKIQDRVSGRLFNQEMGENVLRKELVKCYVWSIILRGSETWELSKLDQKYSEILRCGAGEGWRRSVGPIV